MLKKNAKPKAKAPKKEAKADVLEAPVSNPVPEVSEKEVLLALYQQLKDLGINSIGDLEVKISRL